MKLSVKNFRSIEDQNIELAPITVIYGPNGSGKSSLLYSLLTVKNIVSNPLQEMNAFFNYAFANLGNFDAVIFNHNTNEKIIISIVIEKDNLEIHYGIALGGDEVGCFHLSIWDKGIITLRLVHPVTFPYYSNRTIESEYEYNNYVFKINWNGIIADIMADDNSSMQDEKQEILKLIHSPIALLNKVGVVPFRRGFSKPFYSPVSVTPLVINEDEVATELSNDKYLVSKISFYLEKIFGQDFRVNSKPGMPIFSLDTTNKNTGIACELVNEGFGINQFVYLLAKCLRNNSDLIVVEEPEIHLNPSSLRNIAKSFVDIMRNENKNFIITTHSESFLLALLAMVAKGELKPENLACYLAQKKGKATIFERQMVNENGQIEGGLSSFLEGELEDIRTFLGVSE